MSGETVDEILINYVRENTCLYDKKSPDYKNIRKKKDIWENISFNMMNIFNISLSAAAIEKRWSSLRDQFSRENRKKKLAPSGSGYEATKEWELYKSLVFLIPHIAHRRTTSSLQQAQQTHQPTRQSAGESSCQTTTQGEETQYTIDAGADMICFDDTSNQTDGEDIIPVTYGDPISRPSSALSVSACSSYSSQSAISPIPTKKYRKVTPEADNFAKRRRVHEQLIDKELSEASSAISAAANSMSTILTKQEEHGNGYMIAIQEGLKHVPNKNKTQCLIEVLQVIQKFEERL